MSGPHKFDFVPVVSISATPNGADFDVISPFPWVRGDYESILIPGLDWDSEREAEWDKIIKKWTGVVAICGRNRAENKVLLIRVKPRSPVLKVLFTFEIDTGHRQKPEQLRSIAWSLSLELKPLLVLAGIQGIVYVYDPTHKRLVSSLRGHGGRITSIAVHPRRPHIIATTSRDHTMRLWDLHLPKSMRVIAADPDAARLGPPFGNPLTGGEEEGPGPGKCFTVTVGGELSDGHKTTVLDASFHPSLDIIATSSVDHSIIFWAYKPPPSPTEPTCTLSILGRPVFRFRRIHLSQVIRVHWLSPSILISQSSQSFRAEPEEFPGKIVVWEWLHYETLKATLENGREYARDYLTSRDSSSFKILADIPIRHPIAMPVSISNMLAVLTTKSMIRVIDLSLLPPRPRPNPDQALTHSDLYINDPEGWKFKLRRLKAAQWDLAQNEMFPGVIDVVNTALEESYNAILYHGMLIRVSERERLQVWMPREAL